MKSIFAGGMALAFLLLAGCGEKGNVSLALPDDGKRPLVVAMTGTDGRDGFADEQALARRIAAKMGRALEIKSMPFEYVLPSVKEGSVDFAISLITITEKRAKDVDFSIPYDFGGASFLYHKGDRTPSMIRVEGKRIGVVANTTIDAYLCDHGIDPIRYDDLDQAVAALKDGKLYTILYDNAMLARYTERTADGLVLSPLETRENYGVAINKNRGDILAAANAVIEADLAAKKGGAQ